MRIRLRNGALKEQTHDFEVEYKSGEKEKFTDVEDYKYLDFLDINGDKSLIKPAAILELTLTKVTYPNTPAEIKKKLINLANTVKVDITTFRRKVELT